MKEWWHHLRGDPVPWLLAGDDPSLLYFFLVDVMERPPAAPAVRHARQAIAHSPVVRAILADQHPDGWWGSPWDPTQPRYAGTVWRLILLAELGASGQDFRIAAASQRLLDLGWESWDGPQVAALVVRSLVSLGYCDDPQVQAALEGLVAGASDDDTDQDAWGAVPVLWALAAVPPARRTSAQEALIARAAERFLAQDFTDLDPAREVLAFPPFGPPDLLLGLRAMVALGCGRDPRLAPLVERLVAWQDSQGRWPLDRGFSDGLVLPLEVTGQPSRWVTLNALHTLDRVYGR